MSPLAALGESAGRRMKFLNPPAIALAVLGLNLMGDGLRDLLDPKLARLR